ncbi:MAG: HD domain-containing protein [Desulfobulbaceae bacterium]|nr:HD domain-containing protein [Desulfobulbaceae bacterium]
MNSLIIPKFENYVPVSKNCLMKIFGEITFDLFIYPSGKKMLKEPVLLLRKNTLLADKKDIFTERNFAGFFIRKDDVANFHHLIENFIHMLIDDAQMTLQEKSEVIYNCAQHVIQDVFEDPRSGKNIKRAKDITSTIIQFALLDNASIPSLLQLSSHDYYTFTHCLNVAVFSIGLWQSIFPKQEQELMDFALGCILHDVGKSRIDDAILNKPGPLTAEEFDIIKRHPQYGYDLMKDMVKDISLDVILHHHEKHDGRGYPEGLKGEQISDPVKIAAIADVYDALTTRRAYAEARDPFKAMLTMKEEMVGHFEQEKFISFIHMLSGKKRPTSQ